MHNSPTNPVEQQVEQAFPAVKWTSVRTLVAVSGGPDSVALLRILVAISKRSSEPIANLVVGHVNHRLRGGESENDENFVAQLAGELGVKFLSMSANPPQSQTSPSEETLRDFRYDRLLEMAQRTGARYIATGHNFDDQVETILFRIFRGTGISGLAGIPRFRLANESATIVRPMLEIRRSEILTYLETILQDYRVDQSNNESTYTRNLLRNSWLPELQQRFGDSVPRAIARLGEQAREVDDFLTDQTAEPMRTAVIRTSNDVEIDCQAMRNLPPILVRQCIFIIWKEQNWPRQAMTFRWCQDICDAIQDSRDIVLNLPCHIRFEKTSSVARLSDSRQPPESG